MNEGVNGSLLTLVYQGPNCDVLYFSVCGIYFLKPGSHQNTLVQAGVVKNHSTALQPHGPLRMTLSSSATVLKLARGALRLQNVIQEPIQVDCVHMKCTAWGEESWTDHRVGVMFPLLHGVLGKPAQGR